MGAWAQHARAQAYARGELRHIEAERLQDCGKEKVLLEAVAAAPAGNELGLQAREVERNPRPRRTSRFSNGMCVTCARCRASSVAGFALREPSYSIRRR
jgi:hypothetical protein